MPAFYFTQQQLLIIAFFFVLYNFLICGSAFCYGKKVESYQTKQKHFDPPKKIPGMKIGNNHPGPGPLSGHPGH